jgi:glycosyltransferase involved in cell wall biosynthesis
MPENKRKLKIAVLAALSDKKLRQKLEPLASLDLTGQIDLYRRRGITGLPKTRVTAVPAPLNLSLHISEIYRLVVFILNAWRYDIIIGVSQKYHGLWAWLGARLFGKPLVQIIITGVKWSAESRMVKFLMLNADACGVRGDISARELRELGFKGEIRTIHNPSEIKTGLARAEKKYELISVGGQAPAKDYPWMMEVLRELKKKKASFKMLLCGDNLQESLSGKIKEYGLADNIVFAGYLDEAGLDKAYAESKVLLMTSLVEGLPMAAVEAMSRGLPVVVTSVGELPWLVRDGLDGRVLPRGDTACMAEALASLLADDEAVRRKGMSALERIKSLAEEFSTPKIAENWLALLEAAIKAKEGKKSQ